MEPQPSVPAPGITADLLALQAENAKLRASLDQFKGEYLAGGLEIDRLRAQVEALLTKYDAAVSQIRGIDRVWKMLLRQTPEGTIPPGLIHEMSDALIGIYGADRENPPALLCAEQPTPGTLCLEPLPCKVHVKRDDAPAFLKCHGMHAVGECPLHQE